MKSPVLGAPGRVLDVQTNIPLFNAATSLASAPFEIPPCVTTMSSVPTSGTVAGFCVLICVYVRSAMLHPHCALVCAWTRCTSDAPGVTVIGDVRNSVVVPSGFVSVTSSCKTAGCALAPVVNVGTAVGGAATTCGA